MKMKKRILAAVTACGMMLAGMPIVMPVSAAATGTTGHLTYEVYNGYVEITDCNEMAMSVDIPAEIEGQPVTTISFGAFDYCTVLKKVTVPETVTMIQDCAFDACSALTEVELSEGLLEIQDCAFRGTALTSITIPDTVTLIEGGAFDNCDALESVDLGSGVTTINSAFFECDGLTEITIPANVKYLKGTFQGCVNLSKVNFAEDSQLLAVEKAFDGCTSLEGITLPESVLSIRGAFAGCTALKSIAVPDAVTNAFMAFLGCTALETVTIGADSEITLIESAFEGCTNLKEIVIPSKAESINWLTFQNCTSLEKVTFLNAYTDIPNDAAIIPETAVIHCYENSTAHAYALVHGREFVIMAEPTLPLGDLSDDGTVDASDAAMLLVAAAAQGAGEAHGLTDEQTAAADLNADGTFDAIDAAYILQYAAYAGAGGEMTLEEFLANL
ncbi:MAG: leucine-rich repeat protein [Oscillospiraceae bacterium]|nr:leucine-rich repeat protein [Oscillospiraceae bacterium]